MKTTKLYSQIRAKRAKIERQRRVAFIGNIILGLLVFGAMLVPYAMGSAIENWLIRFLGVL